MIANVFDDPLLASSIISEHKLFQTTKKSCILIGSAPSLIKIYAGNYIDNPYGHGSYVVRVNRPAQSKYKINYGGYCDSIFSFSAIDSKKDLQSSSYDVSFLTGDNIKAMHEDMKKSYPDLCWPTTGFLAILLAMYKFDHIELLGFGNTNVKQQDGHFNETVNSAKGWTVDHDFNVEHAIVDNWILNTYKGKIIRLEDKFK